MTKKILLILPLILLADSNTTTAERLYIENSCNSCHGNYAEGMGSAPRLIGRREEVLLKRLKALQKGKTRSPFGGIMISFAKSLDDNQTKMMAKYLSHLKKVKPKEVYEDDYSNENDSS